MKNVKKLFFGIFFAEQIRLLAVNGDGLSASGTADSAAGKNKE